MSYPHGKQVKEEAKQIVDVVWILEKATPPNPSPVVWSSWPRCMGVLWAMAAQHGVPADRLGVRL
jgi:hypothetical protein